MADLRVTASFRADATAHNRAQGASRKNAGGGLAMKAQQLQLALPALTFVSTVEDAGAIHITEQLYFSGDADLMEERIEAYQSSNAYKILWTSDLESFRWQGSQMRAVFDASDVIACNSAYMRDLFSVYVDASKLAVLTDPMDTNWVTPGKKKRQIYGCSQVILQKGIADVVSLFAELGALDIRRVFLGSPESWGLVINPESSYALDRQLYSVCDHRIEFASRADVKEVAAESWLFTSFARFESFGYAMIEALLAGCWVFCGDHSVYRDRPVFWFSSVEKALVGMLEFMDTFNLEDINDEGRQFVMDNYSMDVFRGQFADIVGRCF